MWENRRVGCGFPMKSRPSEPWCQANHTLVTKDEEGMTLKWGETPKVVASSKESMWETRLSMDMAT